MKKKIDFPTKIIKKLIIEKKKNLIYLCGDLGTGKTTFTKQLVKDLGGDENSVSSPTYTYLHSYKTKYGIFFHLDGYRLKNTTYSTEIIYDLEQALIEKNIVCIEWPEKIFDLIRAIDPIIISFEYGKNESERIITIISPPIKKYSKKI